MAEPHILHFFMPDHRLAQIAAGKPSILTRVIEAVKTAGWDVNLRPEAEAEKAARDPGFHLVVNKPVTSPRCLSLRRCYLDPFWRIENTNDRWDWPITDMPFAPDPNDARLARGFLARRRDKLFADSSVSRRGFTFMPLQGKLLQRRYFQAMSPVDMIAETFRANPRQSVIATLHPGETYSDAEMSALMDIKRQNPGFQLSSLKSDRLLLECDRVITQNSSLALRGFFLEKPAILFARIDFHHIAGSVVRDGLEAAFQTAAAPPFADYLFWFFKRNSITSWDANSAKAIRERLSQHGWPV